MEELNNVNSWDTEQSIMARNKSSTYEKARNRCVVVHVVDVFDVTAEVYNKINLVEHFTIRDFDDNKCPTVRCSTRFNNDNATHRSALLSSMVSMIIPLLVPMRIFETHTTSKRE